MTKGEGWALAVAGAVALYLVYKSVKASTAPAGVSVVQTTQPSVAQDIANIALAGLNGVMSNSSNSGTAASGIDIYSGGTYTGGSLGTANY